MAGDGEGFGLVEIRTLRLMTDDLTAQRAFYAGTLGLPTVDTAGDALTLQIGASRLTFAAGPAGWSGVYHAAFDIPEHQFAAAREWLEARAPLIGDAAGRTTFHFADWQAHAVYCRDPAGNLLELIARHTRPGRATAPFSARSLLAISEIGLVVDDVPAMVARLRAELGAEPYRDPGADFAAVGDETGLLIVVRRGRSWYPDRAMPATPLPLTVEVIDRSGALRTLTGPPCTVTA
jgi:catechol-2,3-dioxygenase